MDRCESCQSLTLEYLYGLLDGEELNGFLAHVEGCAGCRAALERARGQQQLLAAAAKPAFPTVHFQPPPEELPVSLPLRSARRSWAWRRWAVAAAVLLALAGLGIPAAHYGTDYAKARTQVADHQTQLAVLTQKAEKAHKELQTLPEQRRKAIEEVDQQVRKQQIRLRVEGPASVQAGGHNEYKIFTENLAGQKVATWITTVVRNQNGEVVCKEENIPTNEGEHRLVLPPDLPLAPNTRLSLEVMARKGDTDAKLSEHLDLVAPLYQTHLATDKPMYRPGEVVRFRSLTLERFSLKPANEPLRLVYSVLKPSGERVAIGYGSAELRREDAAGKGQSLVLGPDGKPLRGLGVGQWLIEPGSPGGEYTLIVSEQNNRFPEQQRKFLVNNYQPPRLNKELDFSKKTYGAGEEVTAACKAARSGGGAKGASLANARVEVTVKVDGQVYGADGKPGKAFGLQTDAAGKVAVRFKLPEKIEKGEATVTVAFFDGGSPEPLVRPIPLVLKKLDVEFFPEGGDLVAGVANRVYFRASTRTGKPADLKARLVDDLGKVVVPEVATLTDAEQPGVNQGMGAFTFTPQAGRKYELKIDQPAGIESKHVLPDVKDDGVVLSVREGLIGSRDPIRVVVRSGQADRKLFVGAYCRGRLLDHKPAEVKKGESAEIALWPAKGVGGVYRVTVFEDRAAAGASRRLVPVAERLVYRQPAEQLLVNVRPDKKVYVPGDRAKVSLSALTEQEHPAGAVLWVAVVDKSVVTLADEKTARSMPTHFYLTTEVRKPDDLEYADFLVGNHPKAAVALDLLLGTQGWRRFAEQDPNKFRDQHKDEAERLLVMTGQSPRPVDFEEREKERVLDEFDQRFLQAKQQAGDADREFHEARSDQSYLTAAVKVGRYEQMVRQARAAAAPILGLVLGLFVLFALALALIRRSVAWHVAWVACALLLAVGIGLRMEWGGRQSTVAMSKLEAERRAAPAKDAAADAARWKAERGDLMVAPEAMLDAPPADDKGGGAEAKLAKPGGAAGDFPRPAPFGGQPPAAFPPRAPGLANWDKAKDAAKGDKGDERLKKQLDEREAFRQGDGKARFQAQKEARMPAGGAMPGRRDMPQWEEQLRQLAEDRRFPMDLARGGRGGGFPVNVPLPPFVVREYAHVRPQGNADQRQDFTETVFWQPALVTADGKAEVAFDLSDAVTTYQVAVMGHTLDGRLGATVATFDARLPLTLEPKVPFEVTATDKIDVPLSVANNTLERRTVTLRVPADSLKGLTLLQGQAEERLTVEGDRRTRRVYRFQPNVVEGQAALTFEGRSEPFAADIIQRKFAVVPDGFPVAGSRSDLLEGSASYDVVLPDAWVKGTLQCQATVYPSTLADLQKGLEAMLREPNGCFEQTSTSNYPNLLILDYLKESDQAQPDVEKRARDLLARGYQKLTSFECPWSSQNGRHGFEWFGMRDQGHEALTAYGLLQFRDMSRVQDVDPAMLKRTRDWLMGQRDGKGGFKRNARALDTFGRAPENITNAYIIWAVTESGKDDDVTTELKALFEQAKASKDAYFLALVANSLINRGRAADAVPLLKKVAAAQKDDGRLDAEKTSITGSGGRDLQIETTALAVMAWLKANNPAEFNPAVQKAVKWIGQQRGGYGGFGSTQSTILALKALIAYTKANKKTPEAGTLKLYVGDRMVTKLDFAAGAKDALELKLPDTEKHLQPGKNRVRVEITGKNAFPCTLAWSYRTLKPVSADDCPVRLATRLEKPAAKEGQSVTLHVTVENPSKAERSMVVAIIGLPAGLSVPEDMKQLKRHAEPRDGGTKPGLISYFELRNRELILYWRGMAPGQKVEVPVELVCRVPGEYRGPASRAYLYYNADHKHWVEPLSIAIQPREE